MENFACNECGSNFASQLKMKMHHRNQHMKKPCKICHTMIGAPNMSRHMKDIHSCIESIITKKFKCDICTESFARKDKLEMHTCLKLLFNNKEHEQNLD